MPPKKQTKSGNAGKPSKSPKKHTKSGNEKPSKSKKPVQSSSKSSTAPGSKNPLSLLNERCQKEGWGIPIIHTHHRGSEGWSFTVVLSRHNNKTSQKETVRMEPHSPYLRPTVLEAKYWGATYALYRFCNGIQLNHVLPSGPRCYWNELAAEHQTIPDHQKWMYAANPFLAQQEKRQAKAAEKCEEATGLNSTSVDVRKEASSNEFLQSPEVKMAAFLRELVEGAIREELSLNPGPAGSGDIFSALSQENVTKLSTKLGCLGFNRAQIQSAKVFLSQSSLSSKLLSSLTPLEACIEYLILHIPEYDLPQRFFPGDNSSNSAQAEEYDLTGRWIEQIEHLVPRPQRPVTNASNFYSLNTNDSPGSSQQRKGRRPGIKLDDAQLKRDLEAVQGTEKYKAVLEERRRLPAFKVKDDFLNKLEKNRVVVVVGETGCGKTTQLPQFILDSLILSNRGSQTSIIVTQPRRISAISVAARVSHERLEDGSVGYAIRGESKQNANTKLLFCTTGVVLRRLGTGDNLEHVSHIVVDEVHERSLDGDFLLLELRELLKSHLTLKVVLMSATINHETFVKYFNDAPLLTIPGIVYPVTDIYLEEIIPKLNYRHSAESKSRGKDDDGLLEEYRAQGIKDSHITTIQSLVRSQWIDYRLISALINHIVSTATIRGGILIFLPGVSEIKQCIDSIHKEGRQKDVTVLPLHANLPNDEQRRVFEKTTTWKIIAATNVAETSITINDVIYIIDAGKVKETQYDPESSMSRLAETWVTQAAAKQRRGRAGRTQPGTCYKLYTRKQEMNMAKFPVPEILRVPLESVSLAVKATKENQDVKVFLSQAIDPPSVAAMDRALATLEELGAIDNAGTLTALGKHISMLPLDVRLAKMLILATIFQCLGPIVTIAALLSSKQLFYSPLEKRREAAAARARFISGNSDLLTDVSAFHICLKMRTEGRSHNEIKSFCEENFISFTTVREVTFLRQDFVSSLAEIGFIPLDSTPSTPVLNSCSGNTNLVKAVMLGGLWPRVARVQSPKDTIELDKLDLFARTIQHKKPAKECKMYDLRQGRVFLHPSSVLFGASVWKSPFLFYFHKQMTSKVYLRDASEVPIYALLLFGGQVTVNHALGGITVGNKESFVKLRAWPRIRVLVNQLRRLLDAQLQQCFEEGTMLNIRSGNPIAYAIMALLTHDGLLE